MDRVQLEKLLMSSPGMVVGTAMAAVYVAHRLLGKKGWVQVGEVTGLYVYPVKSCKGYSQGTMHLDRYGAVNDRRYMVVDENARFVTQRQESNMCKIRATVPNDGVLVLDAPGVKRCTVDPMAAQGGAAPEPFEAGIWDDEVAVVDQGSTVSRWLSDFLGRDVRLVGMASAYERPTSAKRTPPDAEGQAAFSDGYPLLLVSNESLGELNRRLKAADCDAVPMDRFRPNIVVSGVSRPFGEDSWGYIRIGHEEMHVVKPCSRCKIPTTDQATGFRSEDVLLELSKFRRKSDLRTDVGDAVDVFFGQNVCHTRPGAIRVGDKVWAWRTVYPWTPARC